MEHNVPIGCAGVLVCPGDIMLGDDDGVVVNDVVEQVLPHEDREDYIRLMLSRGAALDGLYPMAPDTEKAFLEWPRGERGR